jgi:hypothetical protein
MGVVRGPGLDQYGGEPPLGVVQAAGHPVHEGHEPASPEAGPGLLGCDVRQSRAGEARRPFGVAPGCGELGAQQRYRRRGFRHHPAVGWDRR